MLLNPFHARPGAHAGRACIIIYDENGEPTGKYCFSEAKAQKIIARLEKREGGAAPPPRLAFNPYKPRFSVTPGSRRGEWIVTDNRDGDGVRYLVYAGSEEEALEEVTRSRLRDR
jgi:hypothetical protein